MFIRRKLNKSGPFSVQVLDKRSGRNVFGGRIKKESKSVQNWVLSLEKNPHELNGTVINGDERIIVSYSEQRAAKDRHNRDIAKTISTVTIRLEDGTTHTRTLLNATEERQLAPLLPV